MKLHRVNARPDWSTIAERRRNEWQRLAAMTRGVVTPPNVLTIVGLLIVLYGLFEISRQHFWLGFVALLVGRLCDVADGWVAERTHTKSPLGEILDATADKIGTFATVIVLYGVAVLPLWAVVALALPHAMIGAIATVAFWRNKRLHPSRLGKISMMIAWLAVGGFVLLHAAHLSATSLFAFAVYAITLCSTIIGLYAAMRYLTARQT